VFRCNCNYFPGKQVSWILTSSAILSTANYIVSRLVMHLAPETTERMRGFLIRFYRKLELIPDDYPR
jgi:hypothetical protein